MNFDLVIQHLLKATNFYAPKEHFQDCINDFVEIWIVYLTDEGITNYIHLLAGKV
jgi:hypothetical protein